MAGGYDNRDGHIWMDGEMVDWREANVHIRRTHGHDTCAGGWRGVGGGRREPVHWRVEVVQLHVHSTQFGFGRVACR